MVVSGKRSATTGSTMQDALNPGGIPDGPVQVEEDVPCAERAPSSFVWHPFRMHLGCAKVGVA
jgi:hypothetical protein